MTHLIFRVLLLGLVLTWWAPLPTLAVGFDCDGSLKPDEKAICADAALSKLDDDLNEEYKILLRSFEGRNYQPERIDEERRLQRAFLRERRACGADIECIRLLYEQRIADLRKATGTQVFDPQNPADSATVDQALQLLSVSLKCAAEPVQEGADAFSQYEYRYVGDNNELRVGVITHTFEGFKFPDSGVEAEITIPGINAAIKSIFESTYTAPLRTLGRVRAHDNGELEISCAENRQCIVVQTNPGEVTCETRDGSSCPEEGALASAESRIDTAITLEGLCKDQVENAAVALKILIGTARER
jgi:uncharacterized protein